MITLLAFAKSEQRHLQEIGFVIAAVGGLALVVASVLGLMSFDRRTELTMIFISGILIAAGALVAVVGLHGGL